MKNDEIINKYTKENDNLIKIIKNREDEVYKELDEELNKLEQVKIALQQKSLIALMGCLVSSTEENPIVGTQALDTCHGILFYNRRKKIAMVGHESPSSVSVINQMLQIIGDSNDNETWEYMIVSGYRNLERHDYRKDLILEEEIFRFKKPNVKLIPFTNLNYSDVKLHEKTLSYEFAFNAKTGEFVTEWLFWERKDHDPRYIGSMKHL